LKKEIEMKQGRLAFLIVAMVAAAFASAAEDEDMKTPLVGKTWLARSFGDDPAMPGVHSTLTFAEDGTVSGSGGCNRLNGSWELAGDDLTFGPFAATMMMCVGGRMEQESAFLASIQKGGRVEMAGEAFLFHSKGGSGSIRFVESKPAKLSGSVYYLERMALPKESVITVRLLDVSKMDVPAAVLANQIVTAERQVPIPFTLEYESAEIDERMTYAVDAEVRVGDRLMFRSTRQHPVLTRGGAEDEVEIEMERVK
jgi:putative lipoprotein